MKFNPDPARSAYRISAAVKKLQETQGSGLFELISAMVLLPG